MATDGAPEVSEGGIAIVGMSLRVTGARNVREFWNNLVQGVESIRQLTDEELIAAGESPERIKHPRYVKSAGILPDMELFDPEFFGLSPKEGGIMDPQHRHLLECAWEALEDAGHMPETFEGPIGVWAGCGMGAYFTYNVLSNKDLVDQVGTFLLRHTGNDKDFLATRVSYCLNLRGPSVNIQTACSTSLVAAHYACQSLLSGECDMALAGGVTIEVPHHVGYIYEEGEVLSPDGHCRAFDHRSAGTVFGSGAGIVVLRRLEDALKDGDQIYALIKGSAVNNDGSGKVGYLAPSVEGQASAIAEALAVSGVDADTIGYVECHGTGTAVGDPIEVAALTQAFRETTDKRGYCRIGSVKTNIGHLDTAAGVASLIKASLALKHRRLPATVNFEKANPHIDFASTPFIVNNTLNEFPPPLVGTRRRATVNSLGVGGTNAHMVLEEAAQPAASTIKRDGPELLLLSGRNRGALDGNTKNLAAHLRDHPEIDLHQVASTLAFGRRAFNERRVIAARDREHAIALLESADPRKIFTHSSTSNASVVFMFPGGGAQYPDMGRKLYETEPVFREHVDRGLKLLQSRVDFDPRKLLFPDAADRERVAVELERFAQLPLIFIIEYALVQLWKARGVTPAAMIGHSLGENTAATVAGVLRYEDALDLVLLRARLCDEVPVGGMMSVPLSEAALRPLLGPALDLACVNSPELCVVSGRREDLETFKTQLAAREVECQWLRIQIAGHSRMLDPVLARFGDFLRRIQLSPPTIPIISNRTGEVLTAAEATSPDYWVAHFRNTIRFGEGIATLLQKPGRVFLEVGPGRGLCSIARMHPAVATGQAFIGSLPHIDDATPDHEVFLGAFGRLWAAGVPVELTRVLGKNKPPHVSLPTYAFQRQRYWIEPQAPRAHAESLHAAERMADTQRWYFAPAWRQHYPESGPDLAPRTFLVFVDETGVGDALCDRLRASGDDVIAVRAGDAFVKVSDAEYRLAPEHGAEGYESLIREVLASGKTPERMVHLWLLSNGETFRAGSSFFHRNQELGVFSLLFLAQALATAELPSGLHVSVISRGLQSVAGAHPQYPEQATVLGPVKVMPRELPGVTCASIDLAALPVAKRARLKLRDLAEDLLVRKAQPVATTHPELDALASELRLPPENGEVALVAGVRWVKRTEPVSLPEQAKPQLRAGGVYLITGGLGGIAFTVAKSLAEVEHAKLVLVNRTPLPQRSEWDGWLQRRPGDPESVKIRSVRQLEALGAEVLVCAGDVADMDRMAEIVKETKQRFGALHGVVHAAGVVDDASIAAKRQASVEGVLGPKVYGTLVLDRVLRDEALDFFVLFSSTSTAIAAAGQVDYVAANAFLDAYADKAHAEGRNVISLAWGVWADVGLAVSMAARMGGDAQATHGHGASCDYPLFSAKWLQSGGAAVVRGELDATKLWMLDEHRTANRQAVLPGTGYLELARAAMREVGHDGPFAIEDLYFLRPFDVPDDAPVEFRIRLKPTDEGFAFELHSRRRAPDGAEGYLLHAQAFLRRFLPLPSASPSLADIDARCDRQRVTELATGHRVKQERHLLFGSRWRVLRRYALGRNEAIAHLALRDDVRADTTLFGLHPGLLDIATGYAIELEPSYGDDRLWVPVSYDRVAVYADLTPSIVSVVKLRPRTGPGGFARFDITIVDESTGRMLVDIEGFSMQSLAGTTFETPTVSGRDLERDEPRRELSAPERAFLHNLAAGITSVEGVNAFRQVVAGTRAHVMVSPLDVRQLVRHVDAIAVGKERSGVATFERPNLNSEYVAPRNDTEKLLAGMWEALLGVSRVGVKDDFFELGGHSLIAVRLFAKINKTLGVDLPISVLIENPTIEACARLIAPTVSADSTKATSASPDADSQRRFHHLVPMNQPSGDKRDRLPFFLVAGMFGNVMNLRHLAGLVGGERPFHGLQARGLLGSEAPHETFEDMARDYIAEIRSVQPHGPYLLGGFSGGGLTAWEMARQLRAAGEEVPLVVMLDTPIAKDQPLTRRERLLLRRQNFAERGPKFALEWVNNKLTYRREMKERADKRQAQTAGQNASEFRSQVVEAAFYRALSRYDIVHQPISLTLFRPRLKPMIEFGPGSAINKDFRRIYVDNGWAPFADRVEVFETPGDHDSMVLEPNVRILATQLRASLNDAEQAARKGGST